MNKFIEMPGTDNLVNINHIVSIIKIEDDNYLVSLTSGSYSLNRDEYLELTNKILYHDNLIR